MKNVIHKDFKSEDIFDRSERVKLEDIDEVEIPLVIRERLGILKTQTGEKYER